LGSPSTVLIAGLESGPGRIDAGPERDGRAGGPAGRLDLRAGGGHRGHRRASCSGLPLGRVGVSSTHPALFIPGSTISTRHQDYTRFVNRVNRVFIENRESSVYYE